MALSTYELEKLADDIYKDRIIRGSVYCGNCGYNLRTLRYIYTCPECGNHYNARPLKLTGIFVPQNACFPGGDVVTTLLCGLAAGVLLVRGIQIADPAWYTLGLVFAGIMVAFAVKSYFQLGRFFKALDIARRIAREEADWQDE